MTILTPPQESACALAARELDERIRGSRSASWLYELKLQCAGSDSHFACLQAMLKELGGQMCYRLAVMEIGPVTASRISRADVRELMFDGLDEDDFRARQCGALSALRELAIMIGRDYAGLRGSALMQFWRDIIPLNAPFAHGGWRSGFVLPADQDEAWDLVLEEAHPLDPARRELLQRWDLRLQEFWDDCLLAEVAGSCRLEAQGLVDGCWHLSLDSQAQDSRFRCSHPHSCPLKA